MDVSQALRARRSVRAFTDQVPSAALVQSLLQDAALAPSGGNLQPWHVAALTGDALQALLADVAQTPGEESADYPSYPANLWEPHRSRRYANGEELYQSIGIPREDKTGRLQQLAKNAQFFGAPVGIIVCADRRMGYTQWTDLGIYLQSLMLRATELGLATCAQGFWRRYDRVVKQHLQMDDSFAVVYGVALGYEDTSAPINTMRASRAAFAEWGQMLGFESLVDA